MRIPRIFHPAPLSMGSVIELGEDAANHVVRVLRLSTGAPLILFDGHGGEYRATLNAVEKRRVTALLGAHDSREAESPLAITLAQGIAKGERMDYAIQKAVELGVQRIVPLLTKRCAVRLSEERWEKKLRHWQAVAISACEQCGRNRIPVIAEPVTLSAWLELPDDGLRLTLNPHTTQTIAPLDVRPSAVTLLIGPEGGLDEVELGLAQRAGYLGVRFGPRILRTETAGVAALSILQAKWGDL